MPEFNSYDWILNRDPLYGDLLLLRIDKDGTRRRPVVFFDSVGWTAADWNEPDFKSIFTDEMKRYHSNILPRFTVDRKGRHYFWQFGLSKSNLIRRETQFCAILPLDHAEYDRQRPQSRERQLFEPLESLLNLSVLLANIDGEYERWCLCNRPWNNDSPSMIECNNAQCNLA